MDDNLDLAGYDPFDEPLKGIFSDDEHLILDDVYFEAARDAVTLDGMAFSFLKPPYMNFYDQSEAKKKMMEAYNQREFLLLYGYSGSGKTTLQMQFEDRYPAFIKMIDDFDDLTAPEMIMKIGKLTNLELIHRHFQIVKLKEHLRSHPGYMLIFDNVSLSKIRSAISKLDILRKLNEYGQVPIIISVSTNFAMTYTVIKICQQHVLL